MVLVTGGTGLVGAHLLLHLVENGDAVRAIYRNSESIQKTKNLFRTMHAGNKGFFNVGCTAWAAGKGY